MPIYQPNRYSPLQINFSCAVLRTKDENRKQCVVGEIAGNDSKIVLRVVSVRPAVHISVAGA